MTFDQHEADINAAVDGAFIEPDYFMRERFLEQVMFHKWMRAALYQGLLLKGPTHGDHPEST